MQLEKMPKFFESLLCTFSLAIVVSVYDTAVSQSSDDLMVTLFSAATWHFVGEELQFLAVSNHSGLDVVGWEHNGARLQPSQHHLISTPSSGDRSTLTVAALATGDGGRYTAVATTFDGAVFRKSSEDIELLYPAVINAAVEQQIVQNSSGTVNCSSPNATLLYIAWVFDGQDPTDVDSASFRQLSDGSLRISNAQSRHSGVYSCQVYVPMYRHKQTRDITVDILVKPARVESLESSTSNSTSLQVQWSIQASRSQPVDICHLTVSNSSSNSSGESPSAAGTTLTYIPEVQIRTENFPVNVTVGNLVPGTSYSMAVVCTNRAGEGPAVEGGASTVSVVPSISTVSAQGRNLTSIQLTVLLDFRGSPQPISFRVVITNSITQQQHAVLTFSSAQLSGLEWSTVIVGLDFQLFSFSVVAINELGESGMATSPPTYPLSVSSSAPILLLKSSSWSGLTIRAVVANLGVPAIDSIRLNLTSTTAGPSPASVQVSVVQTLGSVGAGPASVVFSLTGLAPFTEYRAEAFGQSLTGPGHSSVQLYDTSYVSATVGIAMATLLLLLALLGVFLTVLGCRYCRKHSAKSHRFHTTDVVCDLQREPLHLGSGEKVDCQQLQAPSVASPLPAHFRHKPFLDSPSLNGRARHHSMSALTIIPGPGSGSVRPVLSEQNIHHVHHHRQYLVLQKAQLLQQGSDYGLRTPDSGRNLSAGYHCSTFV